MRRPGRKYLCGRRECFAPLRPASHPLRRVLVVGGQMLRSPPPPTLQTDVTGVRCPSHRRPENYYCGVVGALHPCGRRQPFQPCLRAFPPFGAQSPALSNPPAARRMAECANALPCVCASETAASYSGASLVAHTHQRFPIAAAPSRRGSCFLRSRSPRHPCRRTGDFPSVGRRGWSRSCREGTASGGMRVGEGWYTSRAVLLRRMKTKFNIEKV